MPVILDNKNPSLPSVFRPTALLREARRQKTLPTVDVPAVCILDPDGDIVRRLRKDNRSQPFDGWPCYHTQLDISLEGGRRIDVDHRRTVSGNQGGDRGGEDARHPRSRDGSLSALLLCCG